MSSAPHQFSFPEGEAPSGASVAGLVPPSNILSVDVEDYFHVEAFADVTVRSRWDSYESRVERNTYRVLDLLDESGVKGTFFILGWVAERFPQVVRAVVERGHEPACHSYWHRLVYQLEPEAFRADTLRAKDVIEQAAGRAVYGYRAPSYSVTAQSLWALDILAESGFTYDSSIFPIRHDVYGIPTASRYPCRIVTPSGPLLEYPLTTFRVFGSANLPVGGGGYLRIFPFWYTRFGFARARAEALPLITYIHPWEIDPSQPRLRGRLTSRLRHYTNLSTMASRLRRLLALGRFGSFEASGLATAARNITLSEWALT